MIFNVSCRSIYFRSSPEELLFKTSTLKPQEIINFHSRKNTPVNVICSIFQRPRSKIVSYDWPGIRVCANFGLPGHED